MNNQREASDRAAKQLARMLADRMRTDVEYRDHVYRTLRLAYNGGRDIEGREDDVATAIVTLAAPSATLGRSFVCTDPKCPIHGGGCAG